MTQQMTKKEADALKAWLAGGQQADAFLAGYRAAPVSKINEKPSEPIMATLITISMRMGFEVSKKLPHYDDHGNLFYAKVTHSAECAKVIYSHYCKAAAKANKYDDGNVNIQYGYGPIESLIADHFRVSCQRELDELLNGWVDDFVARETL